MKILALIFCFMLPLLIRAQSAVSDELEYQYNSIGLVSEEKTTLSTGEVKYTRYRYPTDIIGVSPGCTPTNPEYLRIKALIDKNMVAFPLETISVLKKSNGVEYVTGGTLHEYSSTSPGQIYLTAEYALETTVPIQNFSIYSMSSGCTINRSPLYKLKKEFLYDVYGNQIEVIEDGFHTLMFYGYNNAYKIAEVAGSYSFESAYSNFDAGQKNGLAYSDLGITNLEKLNGDNGYDLSKGLISKSLQVIPNRTYIISFWKKGGSVTVTGNNSPKLGKVINGWQYHEYTLNYTSGAIQIQQSGTTPTYVDEVRIYPQTAEMQTYTYQPLVGVTSVCSKSNIFEFYEYDDLGRLTHIRDQDGNILKKVNYSIKQTSE